MSGVFVDTWAWYALADARDRDPTRAERAVDSLISRQAELVTTNFVLDEATTLLRYRLGHAAALKFRATIRELIDDKLLALYRVSEADKEVAGKLFKKYADQDLSFTDCTSFAVRQTLELTETFTNDHHFRILRFITIP